MALPPATRRLLRALVASPTGSLGMLALERATAVKHRAFHPLLARLERRQFIVRQYESNSVELTFGGLRALRSEPLAKAGA
jgi:hypothetical protein